MWAPFLKFKFTGPTLWESVGWTLTRTSNIPYRCLDWIWDELLSIDSLWRFLSRRRIHGRLIWRGDLRSGDWPTMCPKIPRVHAERRPRVLYEWSALAFHKESERRSAGIHPELWPHEFPRGSPILLSDLPVVHSEIKWFVYKVGLGRPLGIFQKHDGSYFYSLFDMFSGFRSFWKCGQYSSVSKILCAD